MAELERWRAILGEPDPMLGDRPLDRDRDTMGTCPTIGFVLPAAETEPLLTTVPASCSGGVNDVLLCGLALAVTAWRRRRGHDDVRGRVLVDLEGHGREEGLVEAVDLSRTVGWFTTLFPVSLDLAGIDVDDVLAGGGQTAVHALSAVTEQLRAVPDHGVGYWLLRYLNPETGPVLAGLASPQISFNYLGRFAVPDADDWALVPDGGLWGSGAEALPASHVLAVNAWTADRPDGPQLHVSWQCPVGLLPSEAVHELAELWFQALNALASCACAAP